MKRLPVVRSLAAALVLTSTALAPVVFSSTAITGPSKGNPALGKVLFTKNCVVCHKADGSGGVKLTGNATPNWKDPKIWADPQRAKDDYFRTCIVSGKVKSGMVAWGKQLKPADIENLIAFITTTFRKK